MTFIVFLVACLHAYPDRCVSERIDLPEVTTATGCHLVGTLRVAEWERDNIDMLIKQANCMARPATVMAGGSS